MTDPSSDRDSTHNLPAELCEALAFYDEIVQNTGNRRQSRQVTLAKYPAWEERLRKHFETEDQLLGFGGPDAQATDWVAPPEFKGSAIESAAQTRFIPRYRLGVGGQGEVWLAHDPELDRFVALKVIKETERGSQQTAARFWREAEMTGKLEHPNIVPVYEAGKPPEGQQTSPYYVMRVFGNRHLLRAITAFHSRERKPNDWNLLQALHEFQQRRIPETEEHLRQALNTFAFDDDQVCDRDLKEAIDALRRDAGQQSGRSLQEAIQTYHASKGSQEEFRDLLNRFIDVCNAVAYAHSRGVIHRDLKPQNVMLGEFGETLVVDWGLAKVIGRSEFHLHESHDGTVRVAAESSESDSQTRVGTVVGTPSYMSPEQAWGRVDELTPATDIYSLGGILFAILTGKPPREGNSHTDIIEKARAGKITPPSVLQADVPKPLEAVCLKALSPAINERYTTAKELAADVTRWLADEPVSAYADPLVVRAKRWVKAHQTVVGSTAAAVLVAVVTLSIMMGVVISKNEELETAYELEEEARILAQQNEAEADRQREAAVQQSQLALSTLTSVIFDVQRGLENLPGSSEVRRRLLATSLEKLEEVATEFVEQVAVDRNTMAALMEMGDVILEFGVGEQVNEASLTASAEMFELSAEQQSAVGLAREFYSRAHDIAEALAANDPTNARTQRDLSVSYYNLGDVHRQLGDTQSALTSYEKALEISERLATADPANNEAQRVLSESYSNLGDVSLNLGDTESAQGFYQQSLEIRERQAAADPANSQAQRDLSVSYDSLGYVSIKLGDTESALVFYQQSLDIRERLATDDPSNVQTQWALSKSYSNLGDVGLRLGDTESALGFYQRYNGICERLAVADPNNTQLQQRLARSYSSLGDVSLSQGDTESALALHQQSLDIRERLAAADSNNALVQQNLSVSYNRLGDLSLALGDTESAHDFYQRGLDIRESLAAADSQSAEAQRDMAISYDSLGYVSLQLGETESARALYQKSLEIRERLVDADLQSADVRRALAVSYSNLGDVSLRLGDTESALGFYQQVLDICEYLAAADPQNAHVQRDVTLSYDRLGDVSLAVGETESARGFYQQSLDIREHLVEADPESAEAQRDLSLSYDRLGDVSRQAGNTQSAYEFYQKWNDICERLVAADPESAQAQRDLSLSYDKLGDVIQQLGEMESARDFFRQSLDIRERLATADSTNAEAQRDLSVSFEKLGDVSFDLGDTESARGFYRQSLDIRERLATADSTNAEAQRDLSVSHYNLARVAVAMLEYETALERYKTAIAIFDRMIANGQDIVLSQQERQFVANELSRVEREAALVQITISDWHTFISYPGARSRLSLRITLLARVGRFDEIPQSAEMLRSLDAENSNNLYNAACGNALYAGAIKPAEGESLTGEQHAQRQEYINLALACLRESIDAGWSDFDHMQHDPDLAVLRDLREFEELMSIPPPPPLAQ